MTAWAPITRVMRMLGGLLAASLVLTACGSSPATTGQQASPAGAPVSQRAMANRASSLCSLGAQVHDVVIPGGHEAPNTQPATWTSWITDLFEGSPIATTCPK
ncbi:hypothetical protein [Kutzneria sp. NPDC052558]|uniref:hypothetical protein n=1 Tax=Kutzneria sp. NPDC052558 TaxID=3364121 RepID=UPI0037CC6D25